ncbi:MAG: cytochrome c [Candidatus Dormibacteraceae bacterium]
MHRGYIIHPDRGGITTQTTHNPDSDGSRAGGDPGQHSIPWRYLLPAFVLGVAGAAIVALIIGLPLLVAHRQDLPLERAYGDYAVAAAARLNAGDTSDPLVNDPRAQRAGRDVYTGSCAVCHGSDGKGQGAFGMATYPPATDLTTHDAQEKSDAQLFWIIKNGLSFTGMPGFADQYDDQTIWAAVSDVRALQHGQGSPVVVPTPTSQQLGLADPRGDAVQRGAAIYFAQNCQGCHGPVGNAPGELALRGGGDETSRAVREGRTGMPAYGTDQISNAQLGDLTAYLDTFAGARRRVESEEFRRAPTTR